MVPGLTFRADELAVLESACRQADFIARLEADLVGQPSLVPGSTKYNLVLNPLISEIRQYQVQQARLLKQLDIPEGDEVDKAAKISATNRANVNKRWARRTRPEQSA